MADYFPVISRAIAGLSPNSAETRRAVYERARQAIVRQLRAIEPPVSEDEIAQQRLNLEEAIRKVEAQQAAVEAPARPASPPPPAPPPAAAAPKAPAAPARPQPAAPAAAAKPAETPKAAQPQKPEPSAKPAPAGKPSPAPKASPAQSRPATRSDGRPIIKTTLSKPAASTQRSGPVIALGVLALVAVAAGVFAARGPIMSMFSGQTAETAAPADKPASQSESKSADRLPQDGDAKPAETPPADARPADAKPADAKPADAKPAEDRAAAEPKPAETPAAPAPEDKVAAAPAQPPVDQPAPAPSGAVVAQRAVLYEEGPNQQSGEALSGSVLWRTESVNGGPGQPLDTALRGEIDIPGRNLKAAIILRRNLDATLPASHTIEVQFTLPSDFPNAGVSNVPGVLMKADESARGTAVAGLSVRVTNGFFLIGLSNLDSEKTVNEQLLKDRGWIDVPILYDNGRRAVLTLEKGTPGMQAFNQAFDAWRNASPSAANPAR